MATTRPSRLQRAHVRELGLRRLSRLCVGRCRACARKRATASAASPLDRCTCSPCARSAAMAARASSRVHLAARRIVPPHACRRRATARRRRRRRRRSGACPSRQRAPSTSPSMPLPAHGRDVARVEHASDVRVDEGRRQRMPAVAFERAGDAQRLRLVETVEARSTSISCGTPALKVPVLSNTTSVDARQPIQRIGAHRQHAHARERAVGRRERSRHRQRQRARAADDQQGQRHLERARRVVHAPCQRTRRPPAIAQAEHEPPRDAIGRLRQRGPMRLRAFHQRRQLRQARAVSDHRGQHARRSVRGTRCRRRPSRRPSCASGCDFARQQRLLEARIVVEQHAVGRAPLRPLPRTRCRPRPARRQRTHSRLPSARSRDGEGRAARARCASTCALAMLRTRCSSMRAASSRKTNITAASYQTCGPPRTVSTTLAP